MQLLQVQQNPILSSLQILLTASLQSEAGQVRGIDIYCVSSAMASHNQQQDRPRMPSLDLQGDKSPPLEWQGRLANDGVAITDTSHDALDKAAPQMMAAPSTGEVLLQNIPAVSPFGQSPLPTQVSLGSIWKLTHEKLIQHALMIKIRDKRSDIDLAARHFSKALSLQVSQSYPGLHSRNLHAVARSVAPLMQMSEVEFPRCTVPSLFGEEASPAPVQTAQSGHLLQQSIEDAVVIPDRGLSTPFLQQEPDSNLTVTFQRPLQSPFDSLPALSSQGDLCCSSII